MTVSESFKKVGWEGGVGNHVGTGFVADHIWKICAALCHQPFADGERNEGDIFGYHKHMEQIYG